MQLPVQAQSKLMAFPWEEKAGPAEIAAVATACERNGFTGPVVHAHLFGTEKRLKQKRTG